jgi:hypothetical protein
MLSPATATKSPSILYAQGVLAIICLGLEVLDESRRLPAIWMRTLRNGGLGSVYYGDVTENLLGRQFDVVDYNRKPLLSGLWLVVVGLNVYSPGLAIVKLPKSNSLSAPAPVGSTSESAATTRSISRSEPARSNTRLLILLERLRLMHESQQYIEIFRYCVGTRCDLSVRNWCPYFGSADVAASAAIEQVDPFQARLTSQLGDSLLCHFRLGQIK